MGRFKSVLSTDVEKHLSIKLRGILRPKICKENISHRANVWAENK